MHSNTVLIELGKNHWYTMYLMLIIISGDEEYNCIWFETRGENILEFQLGLYPSKTPSLHHCDNKNFLQKTWFTQVIVKFIPFVIVLILFSFFLLEKDRKDGGCEVNKTILKIQNYVSRKIFKV